MSDAIVFSKLEFDAVTSFLVSFKIKANHEMNNISVDFIGISSREKDWQDSDSYSDHLTPNDWDGGSASQLCQNWNKCSLV